MLLLLGAVVAGALTTLAPCVLPLLPVIIGRTAVPAQTAPAVAPAALAPAALAPAAPAASALTPNRPVVVTAALASSVILFTVLLKVTTAFIGVPQQVWQGLSGGVLIAVGATQLRPGLWDALSGRLGLAARSGSRLAAARVRGGLLGDVLTGAALGPVFSSCSPLYGYLVVTAVPARPVFGAVLLVGYVVGLSVTLLVIAMLGRRAVNRLRWAADPEGWFRRVLGLLLVAVGVLILTGGDRTLQTWVLDNSPIRPWELDSGFVPPS